VHAPPLSQNQTPSLVPYVFVAFLSTRPQAHMYSAWQDRKAQALWREGRLDEVEVLYVQMAAHRPQHADSHFNVGLVRRSA